MKLLLTGSSGPKVAATVATHLAQFHAVFGVNNASSPTTSMVANIARVWDWQPHPRDVNTVIHFAALHAPHRETHSAKDFRRTNVDATRHLLGYKPRFGFSELLNEVDADTASDLRRQRTFFFLMPAALFSS